MQNYIPHISTTISELWLSSRSMLIFPRFSAPVYHSLHVPVFSLSVYSVIFTCSNILHSTRLSHILITLCLLLAFQTQTFPPIIWYSLYIPIFPYPDLLKFNHVVPLFVNYLRQGWRKYGSWHLLLSKYLFLTFVRPASLHCEEHVYIYICLTVYRLNMNYRCYQITLQGNIFTQNGALRSVDWIFIVGAPACRWLGEYVTLDRRFQSLLLKQEAAAAQIRPYFIPYRIQRRGHY